MPTRSIEMNIVTIECLVTKSGTTRTPMLVTNVRNSGNYLNDHTVADRFFQKTPFSTTPSTAGDHLNNAKNDNFGTDKKVNPLSRVTFNNAVTFDNNDHVGANTKLAAYLGPLVDRCVFYSDSSTIKLATISCIVLPK